ncbi:MAG TPA: GreA/GreB family elongation factor [Planctomycetota bacterium]|nr:GreA/GreB family elongation factor [Planctomycetota bacterium]
MEDDIVYVTAEQHVKMLEELRQCQDRLDRANEAVGIAASYGDLSENAEYDAARADVDLFDARKAELVARLTRTRIIDRSARPTGEVWIGSKVRAKDLGSKAVETFSIVGGGEADFAGGEVPYNSPFGSPFCGKKKGDVIEVVVPSGKFRYEILDVA